MRTHRHWTSPWIGRVTLATAAFTVVVLLQLPLMLNPGYFSFDELAWASIARPDSTYVARALEWTYYQRFQYRPLTFNLWLWLSRHFFDTPLVLHSLWVAWGAVNAAMVALLAQAFGASRPVSVGTAAIFALGPYAVLVHGWIGTLADLIWVSCALLITLLVVRVARYGVVALACAMLTTIGLLSKEAAIVICPLLLAAWCWLGREPRWLWAALGSAVPTIAYLILRIEPILLAPRASAGAYTVSVSNIPLRLSEYVLFPLRPNAADISVALHGWPHMPSAWLAPCLLVGLVIVLFRIGGKWLAGFVALAILSLGPVLVLGTTSRQYGYGFAALATLALGVAWHNTNRLGRALLMTAACAVLWQGLSTMREVRRVGDIQSHFTPSLSAALHENDGPIRLAMADGSSGEPLYGFTYNIPEFHDVPLENRISWVSRRTQANYLVATDGRVVPVR